MRIVAISFVLLLTACASSGGGVSGASVPTAFRLSGDGEFASRGAVWRAADKAVAAGAARERLMAEARSRGYTHFTMQGVSSFTFFGEQVVLEGRLYRAGEAPAGAQPVSRLAFAAIAPDAPLGQRFAVPEPEPQPAPRRPARAKPVRAVAPVETAPAAPEPAQPVVAVTEAPVVIEAPEFVQDEPKKPVH